MLKEYLIKPGLLDRTRKLILHNEYIEWESGNEKGNEFTKLGRSQITDFKHGMDWTVWYKVVVGRQFSIAVKGSVNQEVKIRFSERFGMNKEYFQIYSDIVDDIWKYYFSDVVDAHQHRLKQEGVINLAGVALRWDEIELTVGRRLPWSNVAMKEYDSYFALFDRDDATHYRAFRYNEYGTEALWSLAKKYCKA